MRRTPFAAISGVERARIPLVLGLLLVPLLIGGVLLWGLWTPTQHADRVTAAVVNNDVPVTVNGKSVPLGRQFAAALINGGATGGTGSTAGGTAPTAEPPAADNTENFTWVLTNGTEAADGVAMGRYAAVLTIPSTFSADATSISGPAAHAHQATIGVTTSDASAVIDPALTAAISQAATASLNKQLIVKYLNGVLGGYNSINAQIAQAASGAGNVAAGAASVAQGAASLASGSAQLESGLQSLDSGAQSLSSGLDTLAGQTAGLPSQTAALAQGAAQVSAGTDAAATGVAAATTSFAAVVAQLCQTPEPVCTRATAAQTSLASANAAVSALSAGAAQVAAGNQALADAIPQVTSGIQDAASGAADVASGASQADSGGATLEGGAASLADGAAQVQAGAAQVSQGLASAVTSIPTYSDTDISTVSAVVAQPVRVDQPTPAPGLQTVPLFVVVALWFGAMVTVLARRAVPGRLLLSTASSVGIAARSLGMTAALGAVQGLLIAAAAQLGLMLGIEPWLEFAGLCLMAGAVFAVVNQGLVAAFGAVGRLVALLIGILALTVGMSSTVPPVLAAIGSAIPTAPALAAIRAGVLGDSSALWGPLALTLVWCLAGAALVLAGVAARRGVRLRELVPARPASARVSPALGK